MAHGLGAQGQVNLAKKSKGYPHYDVTHRKPRTQNEKIVFSISTRRLAKSVKGLNSCLAQSTGK